MRNDRKVTEEARQKGRDFLLKLDELLKTGNLNPTDPILKKYDNPERAASQYAKELRESNCPPDPNLRGI